MALKPPPPELVATRPHVMLTDVQAHPSQGPPESRVPARYTIGVHQQIIANILMGNRPHVAAAMAGIPNNTYSKWIRDGKAGNQHLYQFAEDVEVAIAKVEAKCVEAIAGKDGDFKDLTGDNAKWFLERRYADGYSKEAATKVNAMLEEFFKRLEANLPPEIFQYVIAAAAGQTLPSTIAAPQLTDGHDEEETPSF